MASYSVEQIREISKISFKPVKPFESIPASKQVRELVSAVRKFKVNRNHHKLKFNPINVNWNLIQNNGSIVRRAGGSNQGVESVHL